MKITRTFYIGPLTIYNLSNYINHGAALINPFFRTLAYEDIHSIELYGVVGYTLSNSLKELRDSSPYDTLDTAYFFYIRVVFYK